MKGEAGKQGEVESPRWGGGGPRGGGRRGTRVADSWGVFDQVILGEIFSDYSPAQVVVKELRASAGALEQRKFISEAQPYRYGAPGPWRPKRPGVCLRKVTFASRGSYSVGVKRGFESWMHLFQAVPLGKENFPSLSPGLLFGTEPGQ